MSTVQLNFEEYGDGLKTPLIIIHGFFASSRNWRQIAKKLADSYHVYNLDMRNHGGSPHHPVMDYPSMVEDVKCFMDEHNIDSAAILGHSMGGKVAMWFALNYPEKVNGLMVADISPVDYQHSFNQTIQALKEIPLDQIKNRNQADNFLETAVPEQSYRLFLLQNLQLVDGEYSWRVDLDIFYRTADNIVGFPSLDALSPFKGKALFVMGGNSHYTNKEAIEQYFPLAEISVLEGANHWLHVDNPEGFLLSVTAFMIRM
ncbi:MAG: alpha/beta fold hydrolase [Methylococcales bacterium]|nr:alpha/beta fold hydrolase [Methylococcales bacterium]